MRWFEGDIVQAVTQSKARNAVFVVFVGGGDEASGTILKAIDDVNVSSKLEGPNFVAIHLTSGTQTFTQFSQIYRDPPVPSLYFIGRNGAPIEIISKALDANGLLDRILHVERIHLNKPEGNNAVASPAPLSSQPVEDPSASSSEPTPSFTKTQPKEPSEDDTSIPSSSAAPVEDRVERAKELLEEKKMKKRVQEEEEARQKELQRRKEGQNVQELRRWQQDQEMKQLKEERLREKRLEQEARQRVLEQIAQDRAIRNARNANAASSSPASSSSGAQSNVAPATSNSNEARIQFRLPDGSTHNNRFEANATLADVRQYVLSNVTLPFQDFALATVFPRREFTTEDNGSTLRDLQLVPSSVMLIIPAGGRAVVHQNSPGLFGLAQSIWMFVTYPVVRLLSLVRLFIFGGPPAGSGPSPGPGTPAPSQPQNQQNAQQDKRPQRRSGGAYRRAGNSNVHRLHQNNSSSDDENNTWNGNSTQQM